MQGANVYFFRPPAGWECTLLNDLSPHIEVGFVAAAEAGSFHPSLNLAKEEVEIDLKGYLKAVKEIHLAQPDTTWRDLGKFSMKAGEGRLTEIQTGSTWGPVKILQAILVQEGTAFILTAAALRKDFPRFQKDIVAALHSFDKAASLFAPIQDPEKKGEIEALFSSLAPQKEEALRDKEWKKIQERLEGLESSLGGHWLFLALQEGRRKISP